ncbi:transposase [Nesterenkonia sp. Act20]|uniref:transposase n=1 Tax=Nesterenkonia sp. Act20 TaxID=1483432 RepID=UPI001C45A448|nr:transposase [Nesterenkonia sp. Act20]
MPKPYPTEFRDDVVRVALNREGVSIAQIAKDFGVHVESAAEPSEVTPCRNAVEFRFNVWHQLLTTDLISFGSPSSGQVQPLNPLPPMIVERSKGSSSMGEMSLWIVTAQPSDSISLGLLLKGPPISP